MFQSLRPNSQIFIFHKGDQPYLEVGYIQSVSLPKPKYQVPPTFGQSQDLIVDIVAKVNNSIINYNGLPASSDIADSFSNNENIVIADNREAMNVEVLNLKQKSTDLINSVSYHQSLLQYYDKVLNDINPEYAEKKQQQQEIIDLKEQLQSIRSMLETLKTDKLL